MQPAQEPAIEVSSLSKTYRIYGSPYGRLLERLPWVHRTYHQPVHALADVNLSVPKGSCVGLVGGNGAGKSTLLKVLSGTTFPTAGSYTIRGRVASLLELGAGFHAEFSGRENIYMNAAMMGLSRRETHAKYSEILDFSELHSFIDAPIRTYSSGMVCRLGFSVAVATDPDVLIIDEILAVGDMHFQRKCVERIWDYKRRGKTLFFCSHSLYDVRQICDTAIWLKAGRVQMLGDAVSVTNDYATYENQLAETADLEAEKAVAPGSEMSLAVDDPRILSAEIVDPRTGEPHNVFAPHDAIAVRVHIKNSNVPVPLVVAVGFTRKEGIMVSAFTTQLDGIPVGFLEGFVTLLLPSVKLLAGEMVVPVWLLDGNGVHRFHQRPTAANLVIQNRTKELGILLQEHEWVVEPATALAARDERR